MANLVKVESWEAKNDLKRTQSHLKTNRKVDLIVRKIEKKKGHPLEFPRRGTEEKQRKTKKISSLLH